MLPTHSREGQAARQVVRVSTPTAQGPTPIAGEAGHHRPAARLPVVSRTCVSGGTVCGLLSGLTHSAWLPEIHPVLACVSRWFLLISPRTVMPGWLWRGWARGPPWAPESSEAQSFPSGGTDLHTACPSSHVAHTRGAASGILCSTQCEPLDSPRWPRACAL